MRARAWGPALLVAAIVAVSRIPFLGPGYGVDSDAWRLAGAARHLHETGEYAASRLPGHPVQEIAASLLWPGGPVAINGAAALSSVVAAVVFALLVRRLALPFPWLSGLALAFVPAIFAASVSALDHLWGLAFFLGSAFLVAGARPGRDTRSRPIAAGLLLALAIGCRITYLFALVPLGLLWLRDAGAGERPGRRTRSLARFAIAALAGGLVAYLPVLATHGPGFLRTYETGYPRWEFVVKLATLDLWGSVGTVAVLGALVVIAARALARRGTHAAPGHAGDRRRPWAGASLWVVGLVGGLFLLLPHDAGYLLPAVPFVLLLFAHALPARAYAALCLALVVSPFVLEVTEPRRLRGPEPAAPSRVLTVGGRSVRVEPWRGPILHDHARRASELAFVERLLARSRGLPDATVLVVHDWLPAIHLLQGPEPESGVRFVATLPSDELERLQGRGVRVRYLVEAEAPNAAVHGYRLPERGASPFEP